MRSTAAVVVLEEAPQFNAGKGAVFNAKGGHELDAAIMEGHTRRAGAVAGVTTIRNPIKLARTVMEHSPHVMLAGAGAEAFADTRPEIERVPNNWFDTDKRRQQLEKAQRDEAAKGKREARNDACDAPTYFGTVGAVALDAQGHIAAATSTGGMTNKKWGRVGDAPIIGAGTWADDRCGVSGTGWGEFYIRNAVAHDICARVAYRGDSLQAAAEEVVEHDRARRRRRRRRDRAGQRRATSPCRSTAAACSAAGSSPTAVAARRSTKASEALSGRRAPAHPGHRAQRVAFGDARASGSQTASPHPARGGAICRDRDRRSIRCAVSPACCCRPLVHALLAFPPAARPRRACQAPLVAERIDHRAHAIAPELVVDRLVDLRAGLHRAIERRVGIVARRSRSWRSRRRASSGRSASMSGHSSDSISMRIADADFGVADLVAHRQAEQLLRRRARRGRSRARPSASSTIR